MVCQFMSITGVVFLCGGTLFQCISSWTTYWKWVTDERFDIFFHVGLYTQCYEKDDKEDCESIEDPKGHVYGTRSLLSLAISLSLIACVLSFIYSYKLSQKSASKSFVVAIDILVALAIGFLVIGNIVYGTNYQDDEKYEDEWDLGTSFYLIFVAIVGLIVGAVCLHQSYVPPQILPATTTTTIIHHYPGAQPGVYGQPMPPAYGQPAYGQPIYGQPANGQPNPYTTAASGQPPAYGASTYPTQPGMGPNYTTQYDPKSAGQPTTQPMDPAYPPPPAPAQY